MKEITTNIVYLYNQKEGMYEKEKKINRDEFYQLSKKRNLFSVMTIGKTRYYIELYGDTGKKMIIDRNRYYYLMNEEKEARVESRCLYTKEELEEMSVEDNPENKYIQTDIGRIHDCIEKLPPMENTIIRWCYLREKPLSEQRVAQIMHVSFYEIRKRKTDAFEHIRALWETML